MLSSMVAVRTRVYHMQSSHIITVITTVRRCPHLKLYMAESVEPLYIRIKLERQFFRPKIIQEAEEVRKIKKNLRIA
jgi:hypothetical protein